MSPVSSPAAPVAKSNKPAMNRFTIPAFALTLVLALGVRVQSQTAAPRNAAAQLQAIKASNDALLKKQTELMALLDQIEQEAAQLKFMAKRG